MTSNFDAQRFWDERCRTHGHTGETDPLLYAYDQPQRIAAVMRALTLAGITLTPQSRILDLGCGTGDFIAAFWECGIREITGIDFSQEVLEHCRKRFGSSPTVGFVHARIENLSLPAGDFDLIVGINVLQHLITNETFERAVAGIVDLLKPHGHVLLMDFSPAHIAPHAAAPYIIVRSRDEYVSTIERAGCQLVGEYGLPRIGVRTYRKLRALFGHLRQSPASASASDQLSPAPRRSRRSLGQFARKTILGLTHPFDRWLFPFPPRLTDMRILIFRRISPSVKVSDGK